MNAHMTTVVILL